MLRRSRLLAAVGVALCALLVGVGVAVHGQPSIRASHGPIVTVGIYENSPKVYTDRAGNPAGLFITLIRAVAQQEKWTLRFVQCTWAQCLKQVQSGRIDLMPDVAYSNARSKHFDFPKLAVTYSWSQVYRNPHITVRSIADLTNRKVAVLRDSIQQRYLKRLMTGSKLPYTPLPVDTYDEGFKAVADGTATVVVSNPFFGSRHAQRYGLVETPIIFEPVGLYFATSKGRHADLLHRLDYHLAQWRENPNSIYFSALHQAMAPSPKTVVPRWLDDTLYLAAAAALLLFMFSLLLRWQVRLATGKLDLANRQLDHVLDASPVVLYLLDMEGDAFAAKWVSPNITRVFGFTAAQALAPGWWPERLHPDDRGRVMNQSATVIRTGHVVQEYRIFDADGNVRHIRDEMRRQESAANGGKDQVVGTWSDLTESREQAERLDYLTNYDPLTGLRNRGLMRDELTQAIAEARVHSQQVAVLCIDLDRFKNINDTLGHNEGDELLHSVAEEISGIAGANDILARTGGDQFILALSLRRSDRRVTETAQKIIERLSKPVRFGPRELVVTASIGVSLYPSDGSDADTLIKHAELALYQAKNSGRNTYRFFVPDLSEGSLERLVMETSLRGAAERDELILHYQPQIDLRSGALVGVEALVRWNHPELGLVSPGHFIPLAEETGIIKDIGIWVLTAACRQMIAWHASGFDVPSVAINLSAEQIEPATLSRQVVQILQETGLDAKYLELEITESTIMRHPDEAVDALAELKALDVLLSIDDFGTGHSSLAYLKRLPLDRLKIDQSFVRGIGRDPNDEAISRTVIELARSLGLETVAEGVERPEQAEFLRSEGCEIAQGYLFSRPLPADELRTVWA